MGQVIPADIKMPKNKEIYIRQIKTEAQTVKAIKWTGENYEEISNFIQSYGEGTIAYKKGSAVIIEYNNGDSLLKVNKDYYLVEEHPNVLVALSENMFRDMFNCTMECVDQNDLKTNMLSLQRCCGTQWAGFIPFKNKMLSLQLQKLQNKNNENENPQIFSGVDFDFEGNTRYGDSLKIQIKRNKNQVSVNLESRYGDSLKLQQNNDNISINISTRYGDDYRLSDIKHNSSYFDTNNGIEMLEKIKKGMKSINNIIKDQVVVNTDNVIDSILNLKEIFS